MLPVALGGVGQEQLNNNFPPPKNLGEAQAGGPRRKALRTSYPDSKNFVLLRGAARQARIFAWPVVKSKGFILSGFTP